MNGLCMVTRNMENIKYTNLGERDMSYRAGIIGTGGVAGMGLLGVHDEDELGKTKCKSSHAGGYDDTSEIDLVAIADIDGSNLEQFGDIWDVPEDRRYTSHQTLLEEESLDVVSVCTPTVYHRDHVIDVAESTADPDVIWCEKPIASSVREANEMRKACNETNTELIINHSHRFTEKLQHLRRLIVEEDIIGEIHSIHGQFRMELLRNSTHLLDTILFLTDSKGKRVGGFISEENEAVDSLDVSTSVTDSGGGGFVLLEDGVFTTIDCTVPRAMSSMVYIIMGSEGKLYLNNDDGEWRYWALTEDGHEERQLPGIKSAWTWDDDYRESFANAASHLVDILNGEPRNLSDGEAATYSLEMIIAFYLSYHSRGIVELPLAQPLESISVTSW